MVAENLTDKVNKQMKNALQLYINGLEKINSLNQNNAISLNPSIETDYREDFEKLIDQIKSICGHLKDQIDALPKYLKLRPISYYSKYNESLIVDALNLEIATEKFNNQQLNLNTKEVEHSDL